MKRVADGGRSQSAGVAIGVCQRTRALAMGQHGLASVGLEAVRILRIERTKSVACGLMLTRIPRG